MNKHRRNFLTGMASVGISIPLLSYSSDTITINEINDNMDIIAHRGCSARMEDNSLDSILCALKSGVDGIEVDIRKTKDNHFILGHDNIKYSENNIHRIDETNLEELQDFHNIVLLDKVFQLVSERDIELYLGLKIPESLPDIINKASNYDILNQIVIQGWSADYFKPINNTNFKTVLADSLASENLINKAVENNIDCVMPHYTSQNLKYYHKYARENGIKSGCWLLNETIEDTKLSINTNPDFLLTNRPITALEFLDR